MKMFYFQEVYQVQMLTIDIMDLFSTLIKQLVF